MISIQKSVAVQMSGSIFAKRVERARGTKIELELMKVIDCFFDGYSSYESNLVSFKTKNFNYSSFLKLYQILVRKKMLVRSVFPFFFQRAGI